MGIKANMGAFVRSRLSGLNNEDICFLIDHILNLIGCQPKNFMKASERNKFEILFKEKFDEICNKYKEITHMNSI